LRELRGKKLKGKKKKKKKKKTDEDEFEKTAGTLKWGIKGLFWYLFEMV
jgi:hypothetical protein